MASSSSESSASVSKSSSVVSLPDAGNQSSTVNDDEPKVKVVRANSEENEEFKFSEAPSLERLRHLQSEFIDERNWQQWQTPRNLLLALVGEVGELSEIL